MVSMQELKLSLLASHATFIYTLESSGLFEKLPIQLIVYLFHWNYEILLKTKRLMFIYLHRKASESHPCF